MKTISYYDLLNMVKNNEYHSVYYHCSNGCKILYVPTFDDVDRSFICYMLKNNKDYREEYARYYLVENILESEMFENNLEIAEDISKENKKIEKIDISKFPKRNNSLKKTALKLNEIIELLNNSVLLSEKEVGKFLDKVNGK